MPQRSRADGGPADRAPLVLGAVARSSGIHIPPTTVVERTEADHHVLLWQVRGQSSLVVEDRPHQLTAGYALWLPVRTRHSLTTGHNAVLLPMSFPEATTATILRATTQVTVDRDLRTLFLALVQTTYSLIRPGVDLTRQILARIEHRPPVLTHLRLPTTSSALAVAEALRLNPGDGRSILELAASVHVSYRTLERAFLAETGLTFRRWRIQNRMEAAGLLLRSQTAVAAVAVRVGYTSASAFARVFRSHHGLNPSQYVARYQRQ